MKHRKTGKKNGFLAVTILFLFFIAYLVYKNITASVFLRGQDKVNFLFYGRNVRFYSIDPGDVDYIITFTSEAKILVPGGYGYYRVGALNKLASLEKKPSIFQRAFSAATSSIVDLYFYPPKTEIFYQDDKADLIFPNIREIFFDKSNAVFIDRIFVFLNLLDRNRNRYKIIETGDAFTREKFSDNYQGNFYKKTYRDKRDNVQILYTEDYNAASIISQIIEGEGIRVVDISEKKAGADSRCKITVSNNKPVPPAATGLSNFLGCRTIRGNPEISDIILELGTIEPDWILH